VYNLGEGDSFLQALVATRNNKDKEMIGIAFMGQSSFLFSIFD